MELDRTPDGVRWIVATGIEAPPETVWDLLVDTARWPEWGVTVGAVEASRRRIAAGTTGRVRVRGLGLWVPFEVTGFDAGRRRWSWDVARIPATGHRVEEQPEGCRVVFEVPLAAAAYASVCRRACRNLGLLAEGENGVR